ncbi:MAG: nucleotidyltransferase family protein [Planctomycetes bacterium]|nr:nucleotidyltransferase family protein [Planctomycetota bacterium]
MASVNVPPDFSEFLGLLNAHHVEYLVIGGYAVAFHGHSRTTNDLDIWIGTGHGNADKIIAALRAFGFETPALKPEIFERDDQIVHMGVEPVKIEIFTSIPGVSFDHCYARRAVRVVDGVRVPYISLKDLKTNKKASGRHKDLDDLENLP